MLALYKTASWLQVLNVYATASLTSPTCVSIESGSVMSQGGSETHFIRTLLTNASECDQESKRV